MSNQREMQERVDELQQKMEATAEFFQKGAKSVKEYAAFIRAVWQAKKEEDQNMDLLETEVAMVEMEKGDIETGLKKLNDRIAEWMINGRIV